MQKRTYKLNLTVVLRSWCNNFRRACKQLIVVRQEVDNYMKHLHHGSATIRGSRNLRKIAALAYGNQYVRRAEDPDSSELDEP